ncbi:hypothetical protein BIW11_13433 [Tropilaelaps mercedesae]|uniref:Uncharacterized protein n=1 Tax=Tropilaelaps mercedesae TaxID=418985 RepID=A0A1V9X2G7_9ACAR|nr:hypothetical protein BIW11_13433 [Tropilaelaps mercedesae]
MCKQLPAICRHFFVGPNIFSRAGKLTKISKFCNYLLSNRVHTKSVTKVNDRIVHVLPLVIENFPCHRHTARHNLMKTRSMKSIFETLLSLRFNFLL